MEKPLDRAVARLHRLPIFSPDDYGSLNPDVVGSGIDLAQHALLYGCSERRRVFAPNRLARAWGEALRRTSESQTGANRASVPDRASVFVSSWSDPAIQDLASRLVRDLEAQGVRASLESERSSLDVLPDRAIVVAPHDFFRLGLGLAWRGTALARSALMLNTASLVSDDFVSALPFLLASRGVLDLSPQMVDIFTRADVPAAQIRPSISLREIWLKAEDDKHPLIHALPPGARKARITPADPRPIDIFFTGNQTAWRSECLARLAPETMGLKTVFRFESSVADRIERRALDRTSFRITGHIAARSKLMLQLTGPDMVSLDWLATLQSMGAGAVVVTDRPTPHPEFRPGLNYFHEDVRHLPDLIHWLLNDGEGRIAAHSARSANWGLLSDPVGPKSWITQAAYLWEVG